jgi:outer membrane protein assembly factor BamB/tRNA A-37 threonylcarbamoyl transferase component Bud32
MIIKKIGTGKLGADKVAKREDETAALDSLRQSLGANNTMSRGTVLQGRYEIEHVIGYGGMSTVYRARDLRFSDIVRTVAIKEMFDASSDPTARKDKIKRFKEEANLLASLNHQSIPKIYDFFEDQDRSYLIMELIEGKNLETILEETNAPLDERTVVEWGIEICDVLSYLHNRKPNPLIFRDMKPSNVMLNQEGRLILIDFGIVKVFQDEKKGTMIGTEGYSPPEQYRGQALPQGDVYALGATLHQLLTNSDPRMEVPFTFHERQPTALNSKLSKDTQVVIMKALEFEKDKRWQSVDIMKTELIKVLNRLSGGAAVSPAGVDATRNLKIDPNILPPAVTPRTAGTNPTIRNENTSTSAIQRKPGAGGVGVEIVHYMPENLPQMSLVWRFACEEEVRSTPTIYKTTLFVGSYDSNLYALDSKTGEFLWKAATEDGICTTPAILDNPNQSLVIVGSEDQRIYAYDVVKGNEVWQVRTSGKIRSSARIYQNFVFFGSDDRHVYALEAKSGKSAWKYRTFGEVRSTPVVHSGFAYVGSDDSNLYRLDISNGSLTWRFRAFESIMSTPIIEDNRLYIGSRDGYLYCVDIATSGKIWQYKTQKPVNSSPILANGKVYFGSADGILYCLDSKKGTLKWKFDTGSQIASSPRINNNVLYFGCVDSNIYALDAEKGHALAYFPTDGAVPGSPVIADNIVYIGSTDFNVYALSAL